MIEFFCFYKIEKKIIKKFKKFKIRKNPNKCLSFCLISLRNDRELIFMTRKIETRKYIEKKKKISFHVGEKERGDGKNFTFFS